MMMYFVMKTQATSLPPCEKYIQCYLFRGAPDIVIKNRVIKHKIDSDDDDSDTLSSLRTFEDDTLEVGKQADSTKTEYPQKLRELIAGLSELLDNVSTL